MRLFLAWSGVCMAQRNCVSARDPSFFSAISTGFVVAGNAFRKCNIDNELVLADESVGSEGVYATVNFDYTIPN